MEIDEALTTYLLSRPGLTALIGSRLFPDETPQSIDLRTISAVVYFNVSDTKDHSLTGQNKIENPFYQYTVYSPTRAGARAISNQIKTALCDYQGTLSGLTVQHIKLVNELVSKTTSTDGLIKVNTVDLEFEVIFEKE